MAMTQHILNALGSFSRHRLDGEGLSLELLGDGLALQVVVQNFGAGRLCLAHILNTTNILFAKLKQSCGSTKSVNAETDQGFYLDAKPESSPGFY